MKKHWYDDAFVSHNRKNDILTVEMPGAYGKLKGVQVTGRNDQAAFMAQCIEGLLLELRDRDAQLEKIKSHRENGAE